MKWKSQRVSLVFPIFALLVPLVCYGSSKKEPLVVVQNGKYGYIDHEGRIVIQPQFIWAEDFWRGLGTVYVCGRYVSIDSSGAFFPLRIAVKGHLAVRRRGTASGSLIPLEISQSRLHLTRCFHFPRASPQCAVATNGVLSTLQAA